MSTKIIRTAKSWDDFTKAMGPLRQEQRGKSFELLTELLLQVDPVYRTKLKHVWHESNLPSRIRNKLGLPTPEIGVDLVAETTGGEFWAIQCKYHHDPTRNLTKNELNSFLDVTNRTCRGEFTTLLAISSAHDYSVNLKKHAPELRYCLSDRFQALDAEFFRQARAVLANKTPKLAKRRPRPHQRVAIKNAVDHFVTNREARGKLVHPCGTGKSLIGYWIAETLEARTILVALPSLYLIRQTLVDWTKESLACNRPLDWMVVCSEDSIGDVSKDDPSMRFQEIGVDVTTDPDRIATFLRKRASAQKVVFTTYQSGYVTAKASRKARRVFDVGIFDEAHRTVGRKDSLFSHLIEEKNIRIRKRVFMTATERRYQGSSETILSMDDLDAYGETFDRMTFKEALEQKNPILCDYKIVTMVIGKSEVQELIDQNLLVKPDKGQWSDDTVARALAALIALRKVMKKYRANHALTFHNSIAKAEAFKKSQQRFNEAVKGYGKVNCFHVSSKVSTGERKAELDRFRDSRKALITNAKCLTEGVDVPAIDAILFADTKRSTVDIVQAAGRALRPSEGKRKGYIVIPVLVDENDPGATDKAFQDILMTLRSMASNDDRIVDYFRSVSEGKRPKKADSIIEFNVSEPIEVNLDDFVAGIEARSWNRLARLSWMPFAEGREWVSALGLSSYTDWVKFRRGDRTDLPPRPRSLPTDPGRIYADKGWKGYGDWLGTGTVAPFLRRYRGFSEARQFVRRLGLLNRKSWQDYCSASDSALPTKPEDIPATPQRTYREDGWLGWGDWLGTDRISVNKRDFMPFEEARDFVVRLNLQSRAEWIRYCHGEIAGLPPLPSQIPMLPSGQYRLTGWNGWGDWLGTGKIAAVERVFWSFSRSRGFARGLRLRNTREWREYCRGEFPELPRRPSEIPANPSVTFRRKGWSGWGDWLGTETIAPQKRIYQSFEDARRLAHALQLGSSAEWRSYCKGDRTDLPPKPMDIPTDVRRIYAKKGWISWPDWLGTGSK